jgi:hypothetical protein
MRICSWCVRLTNLIIDNQYLMLGIGCFHPPELFSGTDNNGVRASFLIRTVHFLLLSDNLDIKWFRL